MSPIKDPFCSDFKGCFYGSRDAIPSVVLFPVALASFVSPHHRGKAHSAFELAAGFPLGVVCAFLVRVDGLLISLTGVALLSLLPPPDGNGTGGRRDRLRPALRTRGGDVRRAVPVHPQPRAPCPVGVLEVYLSGDGSSEVPGLPRPAPACPGNETTARF